jgi:hypothetical protein
VRFALNKVFFADASSVRDLESIVEEVSAEAAVRRSVFADWHADAINRRSMTINHLPQLNRITCPVTVIHGEKDALVPVASAQEVAGTIPGAQLRVMPQAGHWPNRERPTEFNALLREFVNAVNTQAIAPQKGTTGPAKRDESAEAPTHRLKVPKPGETPKPEDAPGTEDSPAAKDESVDSPTTLLKVGAVSTAPESTESTEDTAGTAESAEPEETESAEAKPAEKTESTESESTDEKSDDADSPEKPADDSAETADAEKKATTDAPTRFLKVGSEPATPAEDEEPGATTEKPDEKSSDKTSEDDEKPKEDDSQGTGDKPAT